MKQPARKPPPPPVPQYPYTPEMTGQAADVGKTLIQGIAPAEKGWVLGFICVVAIIVGSDAWVSLKTIDTNAKTAILQKEYYEKIEENRASSSREALSIYSDQLRRSQEVIKSLAESVARDSERAGDAALFAIQSKSRSDEVEQIQQQGEP